MLQLHWMLNYYTDMNFRLKKNLDRKKKKIWEAKRGVLKYYIGVPSQIGWGFKSECGFKVSVKEKELKKKKQQSQYKDLMSLC